MNVLLKGVKLFLILFLIFGVVTPAFAQCEAGDPKCETTTEASPTIDWVSAVANLFVALILFGTGQQQVTEIAKEILRRSLAKLRGLWPLGIAFPERAKSALLALLVAWLVMNKVDINLFKDFSFFGNLGVTDPKILLAISTVATWVASMFIKNSPVAERLFDATDVKDLEQPTVTWATLFPPKPAAG